MEKKLLVDYLQQIDAAVKAFKEINKSRSCLYAFRGESKDYGTTKLMPSLFRNPDFVNKERYLFELLSDYGVIEGKKTNIEKVIEAQHYVEISRMLDITFNVLPSLYFACSSEKNMQEDATVYIFCFPEHYSPHSTYIEEFYREVLNRKSKMYSKNFKVVSHSYSNDRIKAQSGGFIFFQGKEFSPISDIYYKTISINKDDKKNILQDLSLLFAIDDASIFPEKENKAQLVKEKFQNCNYIEKNLTVRDEIDTFFDRIRYECNMEKKWKGPEIDSVLFLRKLRKEKSDLLTYVDENIMLDYQNEEVKKDDVINKWHKYIEDNFKILERI